MRMRKSFGYHHTHKTHTFLTLDAITCCLHSTIYYYTKLVREPTQIFNYIYCYYHIIPMCLLKPDCHRSNNHK